MPTPAQSDAPVRDIAIVGAGIGGLTLALCLHAAGFRPRVFERAAVLSEVGAGLQLSPNACRVIAALGLLERLRPQAFEPEALELRDGVSGRRIFRVPTRQAAWGAPYLHVHRADLVDLLAGALAERVPGALQLGAAVGHVASLAGGVRLDTPAGAVEADLAVGADGVHSSMRRQFFGDEDARFTGQTAWRATVASDALGDDLPPPTACVWAGDGRHAVTYRLRAGREVNFVGVVEQKDWRHESWTDVGDRAEAIADFAGWPTVITRLLEAAPAHYRWALLERPPLATWHRGRVCLIGDACHPMLPFLAQGAAMAIEDGWVLASMLLSNANPEAALRALAAARTPRVRRVYDAARSNARLFHRPASVGRAAQHGILRLGGALLPGVARGRLDWLYGEDVTARYPLG